MNRFLCVILQMIFPSSLHEVLSTNDIGSCPYLKIGTLVMPLEEKQDNTLRVFIPCAGIDLGTWYQIGAKNTN